MIASKIPAVICRTLATASSTPSSMPYVPKVPKATFNNMKKYIDLPEKPKYNLSSWSLFVQEYTENAKRNNTYGPVTEMSKEMRRQWLTSVDRKYYENLAKEINVKRDEEEKTFYESLPAETREQMKEFKNLQRHLKKLGMPEQPMSPEQLYKTALAAQGYDKISTKDLRLKFDALSESDRHMYKQKALEDAARFYQEYRAWYKTFKKSSQFDDLSELMKKFIKNHYEKVKRAQDKLKKLGLVEA